MADDKSKTGLDGELISLAYQRDVRAWCKSLDCSEQQLRDAVAAVGDSAERVRGYLKWKKT